METEADDFMFGTIINLQSRAFNRKHFYNCLHWILVKVTHEYKSQNI